MPTFPDPILTANVYCSRQLDGLIHRAIAPFWDGVRGGDPENLCYLWLLRYPKRGEHLKIRIHGPRERQEGMRHALQTAVTRFLDSLGPDDEKERISSDSVPPIDVEDGTPDDYPDRALLWTTYRASPVTLGSEVFVEDSRFRALFTRCLGEMCELVLTGLVPDPQGAFLPQKRQSLAIKLVLATLSSLGLSRSPSKQAEYLAHHRDWLVRYLLSKTDPDFNEARMLAPLDAKLQTMGPTLKALRDILAAQAASAAEAPQDESFRPLHASLGAFRDYIETFHGDSRYDLDPYTTDPTFLPIFKVLHNLSNQIGLGLRNELYTYHLLLHAAMDTPESPVTPPVAVPEIAEGKRP